MGYKFVFLPSALQQYNALDSLVQRQIGQKLVWFAKQPNPLRYAKKVHEIKNGDYRFRVGDYRVIVYIIPKRHLVVISAVGHRREIYRKH